LERYDQNSWTIKSITLTHPLHQQTAVAEYCSDQGKLRPADIEITSRVGMAPQMAWGILRSVL